MNNAVPSPKQNQLLARLPRAEQQRWFKHLELVEMPLGEVLYEAGVTLTHVFFPITSIVSLLSVMENGASAEIAVVGNDGIVGISLFIGGRSTPSRGVVQSAGRGYRLRAQLMKRRVREIGTRLAPASALHTGANHADGTELVRVVRTEIFRG